MSFVPNDKVQSANDPSRVGMIESLDRLHSGLQYYKVFWGGSVGTSTMSELDIVPYVAHISPDDQLAAGRLGGYPEFQRLITLQRLVRDEPLRNNIYAFNASRTRFFPYQFKPLLKFLESARHRLLICDEVGLGKTIEAGLILLELRARQSLRLVLVACPSNLTGKWRLELKQRFGEDFRILIARDFREFLDEYEKTPDRVSLSGIVSLETLRSETVRERLAELDVAFDLVIIDEAHHLRNFGTAQRAAGELIARPAQAVIMLTATPVHLGQKNLFSLLNLLDEEDFPDEASASERFEDNEWIVQAQSAISRGTPDFAAALDHLDRAGTSRWFQRRPLLSAVREKLNAVQKTAVAGRGALVSDILEVQRDLSELNLLGHLLTRTRKRDVHEDVPVRRAEAREVDFNAREQQFYETVTELIRKENERHEEGSIISQWRLNTPQRRMASSLQGMVEFYREDMAKSAPEATDDLENLLYDESIEELDEAELRTRLRSLVSGWPLHGSDSKYDCLKEVLRGVGTSGRPAKVLVFATFKHTIRYLERRLKADNVGVVAISGDTPIDDRPAAIGRFKDDHSVQVMLSSRVGSEGLDFQFCSTLINYDLPWNPMEVEQRIGRLDRIGQQSPTILIINLWTKGTVEERILRRLYERIGIFERSIGDLEAILGEVTRSLQEHLLRAAMNPEEAQRALGQSVRVIEERRTQMETLERSAARFVGADAFFEQEVSAIRSHRRFVTGVQLHHFLWDFLHTNAPRTRLEYDAQTNLGTLAPDESLRDFVRRSGRVGEMLSIAGAVGSALPITFDAEVAFQRPQVEFLNVVHPLIVSIAEYVQTMGPLGAAHHVVLPSVKLPEGFYFYFVYRLRIKAARSYNVLETIVLGSDLTVALPHDEAESLLGEMVEQGRSADTAVEYDQHIVRQALHCGEGALLDRLAKLKSMETVTNEAFVEQRLASLRSFYEKSIRKKQELLTRGTMAGRQERYLKMLKGHITRLEGELQHKSNELEKLRVVTAEHEPIAAGILEVVAEEL